MNEASSPKEHLVSRIKTWCGVQIKQENQVTHICVNNAPIARFPTDDSIEMRLCGTIKERVVADQADHPDGIWTINEDHHVIVDLRLPGGMEEAIRVLLNAYINSQSNSQEDWSMDQNFLRSDSNCDHVISVISGYRAKLDEKYGKLRVS